MAKVSELRRLSDVVPSTMFISGKFGIVHREGWCAASKDYRKVPVTKNQCLVYKLPPCTSCWADRTQYTIYVYKD